MTPPRNASLVTISALALLAACGGSHDPTRAPATSSLPTATTATTATTTTASRATTTAPSASAARVVSLTGPPSPVQCQAPTSVELHWETANATTVTLRINGGDVFATYANGKRDELVPLTCDGTPQTYEITARAANGQQGTKSLTLEERAAIS